MHRHSLIKMREFLKELSFRRLVDSLKLTPKHRLLEFGGDFDQVFEFKFLYLSLSDIWAEIFLWCFMTSIVVHLMATIIAVRSLRSHKIGRWYSVVILLAGIITPIIPSAFTSINITIFFQQKINEMIRSILGALLSAIFYAASVEIKPFFCFLLGVGQTGIILFFSFLKILSTL